MKGSSQKARHSNLLPVLFLLMIFCISVINIPQLFRNAYDTFHNYQGTVQEKTAHMQDSYNENIKPKKYFVDLNGLVHKLFGQREMNTVYRLDNGQLTFIMPEQDMTQCANNVISLNNCM